MFACAAIFTESLRAEVLIYDTFAYSDGNLVPQGGWAQHNRAGDPIRAANGQVLLGPTTGQNVIIPFGQPVAAGGKLFVSFDVKVTSLTSRHFIANFFADDSTLPGIISVTLPVGGGNFGLGLSHHSTTPSGLIPGGLLFGTTYKVVCSYDFDSGLSNLWVDPASEASAKITTANTFPSKQISRLSLAQGSGVVALDNLLIGTTFNDVLTAPLPGTPIQGPAVAGFAVKYSSNTNAPIALHQTITDSPAYDWPDSLPAPSGFGAHGNIVPGDLRSEAALYKGWGQTFDENNYIGFTVFAGSDKPLNLTSLNFSTNTTWGTITSYRWGYRTDEGAGFGPWTYGDTYTSTTPLFSSGGKTWDFTDFTSNGAVEFGLFATAPTTENSIAAYQASLLSLNSTGITPLLPPPAGELSGYTDVARYNIDINEASAVAYNWDTDTLFAIGDEGEAVVEISKRGRKLGWMQLDYNASPRAARAIDDAEGLAYLGEGKILIGDERRNQASLATYVPDAFLTLADLAPTSYPFGTGDSNTGLEGIAWDPINNSVWGVKEIGPNIIYEMKNMGVAGQAVTLPVPMRYFNRLGIDQMSDLFVMANSAFLDESDPRRENVLLLGRSANKIFEMDRTGKVVGMLDIAFLGRITVEGMTMDDKGNIYLVSEGSSNAVNPDARPDALFVLSTPKLAKAGSNRGRETLTGTGGDDRISGNAAMDTLTGGGGRDTYVFKSLRDGVDTITDFKPAVDTIDLSALLDSLGYTGGRPFADGIIRVIDSPNGALVQVSSGGSYRSLILLQNLTVQEAGSLNNYLF